MHRGVSLEELGQKGFPIWGGIPHVCLQVKDDLHTDCTSQSLLNPALCSRALSPPTPMKKPLYLPLGHHHFFPSQSYTLCERGAVGILAWSPAKSPASSQGCLGRAVLGLDTSAWQERHQGLLWGTQGSVGMGQA